MNPDMNLLREMLEQYGYKYTIITSAGIVLFCIMLLIYLFKARKNIKALMLVICFFILSLVGAMKIIDVNKDLTENAFHTDYVTYYRQGLENGWFAGKNKLNGQVTVRMDRADGTRVTLKLIDDSIDLFPPGDHSGYACWAENSEMLLWFKKQ